MGSQVRYVVGKQDGYQMSVEHALAVLRARWKLLLLCVGAALLAGIVLTLIVPKRYTATSSVLLDIKSPDPISGQMLQGLMSPSYMNTQVDLITSEQVLRRVVRSLDLADQPQARADWVKATQGQGELEVWLAERLGRELVVVPSKDSNLLRLTFTSSDPVFAARAANAFAKAYIDTNLQLRVEPAKQAKQFFDENAKQARADLESAQRKLSEFERSNGLVGNENQVDVETARLNELSTQWTNLQAQASDTRSRRMQGGSNTDQQQEVLNSGLINDLRADLQRDRTKLREMRSVYGEAHPQIKRLRESISELEARIGEETRRVTGGIAMSDEVNKRRLADLKSSMDAQRERVLRVKQLREDSVALRRDVENAQRAYDVVLTRLNQMNVESQAVQTNATVVGHAAPPSMPSSPNVGRNILAAILLGTMGGLLLVFIREFKDQRIRTEDEVSFVMQQPVIVTLPKFGGRSTSIVPRLGSPASQRAKRLTAA